MGRAGGNVLIGCGYNAGLCEGGGGWKGRSPYPVPSEEYPGDS
jgi:hypothetical protein